MCVCAQCCVCVVLVSRAVIVCCITVLPQDSSTKSLHFSLRNCVPEPRGNFHELSVIFPSCALHLTHSAFPESSILPSLSVCLIVAVCECRCCLKSRSVETYTHTHTHRSQEVFVEFSSSLCSGFKKLLWEFHPFKSFRNRLNRH